MRPRGDGALFRVPKDKTKPLLYWQAVIELPPRDGQRRRRFVRSKSQSTALKKLNELKRDLAATGDMPTASQTLESWLRHWFETIHAPNVLAKTMATHRGLVFNHIIPAIGHVRLDKLTAADVRKMHHAITHTVQTKGKNKGQPYSSTTALQAHRVLSKALRDAERDGRVTRNVATLTDAPKRDRAQLVTLTTEDSINIILEAARPSHARIGSRWAAALLTGARQGELLGLELDRVTDVIDLSWQLQRLSWQHGCGGFCGRVRGTDCPDRRVHTRPGWEHRHVTGGLWLTRPKSGAGWRIVPLVEPLRSIMERRVEAAAGEVNPFGLVWTTDDGQPIDPRDDNAAWHALLAQAGVRDARLHDARHATVDLLYEAAVPEPVITEIVGHSTIGMSRHYKSRGNQVQLRDAMTRMSQLLSPTE